MRVPSSLFLLHLHVQDQIHTPMKPAQKLSVLLLFYTKDIHACLAANRKPLDEDEKNAADGRLDSCALNADSYPTPVVVLALPVHQHDQVVAASRDGCRDGIGPPRLTLRAGLLDLGGDEIESVGELLWRERLLHVQRLELFLRKSDLPTSRQMLKPEFTGDPGRMQGLAMPLVDRLIDGVDRDGVRRRVVGGLYLYELIDYWKAKGKRMGLSGGGRCGLLLRHRRGHPDPVTGGDARDGGANKRAQRKAADQPGEAEEHYGDNGDAPRSRAYSS